MKLLRVQQGIVVNPDHVSSARIDYNTPRHQSKVYVVMSNGLQYEVIRPDITDHPDPLFVWVMDALQEA